MIALQQVSSMAKIWPKRAALVVGDRSMTWSQLQTSTEDKVLQVLSKFGPDLPAQAVFLSENGPELVAWLAALQSLGVPTTGLDPNLPKPTLLKLLRQLGPKLVLRSIHVQNLSNLQESFDQGAVLEIDPDRIEPSKNNSRSLTQILETIPKPPFKSVLATSGSTGTPKLVVRTQTFERSQFEYFRDRYGFSASDNFLSCLPFHHAMGYSWTRLFLGLGATIVLSDPKGRHSLARIVEEKNISTTVATPVLLDHMVREFQTGPRQPPECLRWILVGGKNFSPSQKERAMEVLDVVHEYYGTTETGVNTIAEPDELLAHPRSVGKALPGNDIAIVDDRGRRLDVSKIGRVAIKSEMNMSNYLDGFSEEVRLSGSRYLLTPDQGFLDTERRLHLRNRSACIHNKFDLSGREDSVRRTPSARDLVVHQPARKVATKADHARGFGQETPEPFQSMA